MDTTIYPLHKSATFADLATLTRLGNGLDVDAFAFGNEDPQDFDDLLLRARAGKTESQYMVAQLYETGADGVSQDDEQAVAWYRKAAGQGHLNAQFRLSMLLLAGHGAEKSFEIAVMRTRELAEQGQVPAQFSLGVAYMRGIGVARDAALAAYWYRQAAEQGHGISQEAIASRYENGLGVEKDEAQAAEWYRKAAEQGFGPAQKTLGRLYECGKGVERDLHQAEVWFRKAAEQGNESAQEDLAGVRNRQKQIVESQFPLHDVAAFGDLKHLARLLDSGLDINTRDDDQSTALHRAVQRSYVPAVKFLLQRGADVNACDGKWGRTPLFDGVLTRDIKKHATTLQLIDLLLSAGALVDSCDRSRRTPLFAIVAALCLRHPREVQGFEIVERLLQQGADINVVSEEGNTPLLHAIANGSYALVKKLVECGADINRPSAAGVAPLVLASRLRRLGVIYLLGRATFLQGVGIDPEIALTAACCGQEAAPVDLAGFSPKELNWFLALATLYGQTSVVTALLAAGAAIDSVPGLNRMTAPILRTEFLSFMTPLCLAALFKHQELVTYLLSSGASLKVRDSLGRTPLFYAAGSEKVEIVRAMLDFGADIQVTDKEGLTPLAVVKTLGVSDPELLAALGDKQA